MRQALPPKLLLVETHDDNREMYAEYLRVYGYDVVAASDGAEALTLQSGVDLVVTGVRMRGPIDGLELVRRIRAGDRRRTTPIIVLTACAMPSDRAAALAAGCDAFLPKPCLPSTLVEEVRRLLASHATPSSTRRRLTMVKAHIAADRPARTTRRRK